MPRVFLSGPAYLSAIETEGTRIADQARGGEGLDGEHVTCAVGWR